MRRYLPRAVLTVLLAASAAACAAAPPPEAAGDAGAGGASGGRYRVLIPAFQGEQGERVGDQVRNLVSNMATHTSIPERDMRRSMSQYQIEQLNEITARQLAQQIRAENVLFGTVEAGGAGLQADVKFIDVRSGDEIEIPDVTGADPNALAQAIFTALEAKVEGIRQAAFCSDYLSSQQFERALETCEQALAIVPTSTSALYAKATAQLQLEQNQPALDTYNQLLELDPTHQDALLGAGLAASRLSRSDVAMGFYNRYLEVNPGNVQVRMTVANDVAKTGDYVSAFRVLQPAVEEPENAADADFQRYLFSIATAAGQRVQEQQDAAAARPYFEAAMRAYNAAYTQGGAELDPSALRQAIAVTNALGQREQSLQLARTATERFDTVPAIWSQYATVLTDAGQHAEAVRALTRVVELDPEYENVYVRRAMAYMESGQRQQALADLERSAERGNRETVAQVVLSMASPALQANRHEEAANLLEIARGYAPAGSAIRNQINFFLGFSLYRQGEAIARANTEGRAAEAQRALDLFTRALEMVRGSGHANEAQVASAAQQYIENQRAIIEAARPG